MIINNLDLESVYNSVLPHEDCAFLSEILYNMKKQRVSAKLYVKPIWNSSYFGFNISNSDKIIKFIQKRIICDFLKNLTHMNCAIIVTKIISGTLFMYLFF